MSTSPSRTPPSQTPKHVLFVDDDEFLLEGLRDALHARRREWRMTFVSSGQEALAVIDAQPQDVVVSDLRMPAMDGATLLAHVRDRCPTAVRIVLSGHGEMRMVARAAAVAHRLIAKPCDTDELTRVIENSCALQDMATFPSLHDSALRVSSIPSVPRIYARLSELLASGEGGAGDVARVIETDTGMVAKVLQLANSAYFGRHCAVTEIAQAVAYLGLEPLRALVLQAEVLKTFQLPRPIPGFDLDTLQRATARTAALARALLPDASSRAEAFTSALLKDVGILLLASEHPQELATLLATAHSRHRSMHEIELEIYGATHADLGAHILALWGLPLAITEAVARHHGPQPVTQPLTSAAAVQVATALVEELEQDEQPTTLPATALRLAPAEQHPPEIVLPRWRALATRAAGSLVA